MINYVLALKASELAMLHSLMNQIGSRSSVWCTEVVAFNRINIKAGRPDLKPVRFTKSGPTSRRAQSKAGLCIRWTAYHLVRVVTCNHR